MFLDHDNTDYNTEESFQARDYLAATMQFIPGHFACDVVWSTIIHIHPRLKMGPNMGVARGEYQIRKQNKTKKEHKKTFSYVLIYLHNYTLNLWKVVVIGKIRFCFTGQLEIACKQ